ncbi:MAG: pyridoxal-phosphate dependent enzyme [Gammaproteobacteria bacterium]|nr:pyridoxal-phosphate dependent enzyme [Gammaproteobacteria bacterium]
MLWWFQDQKKKGVISASAGNHALALSYHGQDLGIPVTVVMPVVAPMMKVNLCRMYGANVMVLGAHIGEVRYRKVWKISLEGRFGRPLLDSAL